MTAVLAVRMVDGGELAEPRVERLGIGPAGRREPEHEERVGAGVDARGQRFEAKHVDGRLQAVDLFGVDPDVEAVARRA